MKNRWIWQWLGCIVVVVVLAVVTLSVQAKASSQSFKDVSQNHPFQEMIQNMHVRGLINGYPDGSFRPNETISRKHAAHLLEKALPLEAKTDAVIRYKDVPMNHPYSNAILKVSQAGIFSGDINGNFNPNAPITRVQMAKVLDLAFELNIKSLSHFRDVGKNNWGFLHIQALNSNGITVGNKGYFKPNEPVTRAHYVAFLHRGLKMPKVPIPNPKKPSTKEEILNLVYRLPVTVETTINNFKFQSSPFSAVRTELLANATQALVDSDLKNYYANMCTYCDMGLFPFLVGETDYRFEILENTPNKVRISTVSFDAPLEDAVYLEYGFEKQSGKWKMSIFNWDHVGAGSFDLTKEEALQIVKNDYESYASSPVRVKFLNTKHDDVYDPYTDQDYRRLVYRMAVDTEDRSFNIFFYPHSGFFDEE